MIAAVAAVFASAQVAAATETVRHTGAAGQAGARVEDVVQHVAAAPPAAGRRRGRGEAAVADRHHLARAVRRLVGQRRSCPAPGSASRPRAARPATAVSPPRLTSTPQPSSPAIRAADRSAAHPFTVAPRSSWTPAGTVSRQAAGSTRTDRQPGITRTPTLRPAPVLARCMPRGSGFRLGQLGEVPVIAEVGEHPADRGVDVTVGELRRPQGDGHRLGEQRADRHGDRAGRAARRVSHRHQLRVRPGTGCTPGRARRDRRSSSSLAAASCPGDVTTSWMSMPSAVHAANAVAPPAVVHRLAVPCAATCQLTSRRDVTDPPPLLYCGEVEGAWRPPELLDELLARVA